MITYAYQSVPFEIYFGGTNKSLILDQQTIVPYRGSSSHLEPSIDYYPAVVYDESQDVVTYYDDIDVVHLYIQIPTHLRSLIKAVYIQDHLRPINDTYTWIKYKFNNEGIAELIFPTSWVESSVKDNGTIYSINLKFGLDSSQEFPCGNGQDFYILDEAVSSPLTNYIQLKNEPTMAICGAHDIPLIKDSKGYFIFQGQPYEDGRTVPYGIKYNLESSNTLNVITACIYRDSEEPIEIS